MGRMGMNGTARFYTESGEEQVNDTVATDNRTGYTLRPELLSHRSIEIDDSWERVGRFSWTNNVTVDGKEMQMHAQIQGGIRIQIRMRGLDFRGFNLIGGFVYPGGTEIYHDPEVSGEAFTDIGTASTSENGLPITYMLMLSAIGIIGIASIGSAYYLRKNRREKEFEDLAESALPEEKD
jgi:hypothetical protein